MKKDAGRRPFVRNKTAHKAWCPLAVLIFILCQNVCPNLRNRYRILRRLPLFQGES